MHSDQRSTKAYCLLSVAAVLTAICMISLSLVSVSQAASHGSSSELVSSSRTFYLDDTILPDHVLYPLLMAQDRAELALSPNHRKSQLLRKHAWDRLRVSRELVEKQRPQLALTTLSKAQKYMLRYCEQQYVNVGVDTSCEKEMHTFQAFTDEVQQSITTQNTQLITQLSHQLEACSQRHKNTAALPQKSDSI